MTGSWLCKPTLLMAFAKWPRSGQESWHREWIDSACHAPPHSASCLLGLSCPGPARLASRPPTRTQTRTRLRTLWQPRRQDANGPRNIRSQTTQVISHRLAADKKKTAPPGRGSADQLDDRIQVVGDLDGGVTEFAQLVLVVVDGDVRVLQRVAGQDAGDADLGPGRATTPVREAPPMISCEIAVLPS